MTNDEKKARLVALRDVLDAWEAGRSPVICRALLVQWLQSKMDECEAAPAAPETRPMCRSCGSNDIVLGTCPDCWHGRHVGRCLAYCPDCQAAPETQRVDACGTCGATRAACDLATSEGNPCLTRPAVDVEGTARHLAEKFPIRFSGGVLQVNWNWADVVRAAVEFIGKTGGRP